MPHIEDDAPLGGCHNTCMGALIAGGDAHGAAGEAMRQNITWFEEL